MKTETSIELSRDEIISLIEEKYKCSSFRSRLSHTGIKLWIESDKQ